MRRYACQRQRSHTIAVEITRKAIPAGQIALKASKSSEKFQSLDKMVSRLLREDLPIPNHAEPSALSAEGSTDRASCKAANIEAAGNKGDATVGSGHVRSLMAGLNLDTAIRLRWVLRDIRANRTAWSPLSPDDLAALIELGLVEMRNEIPALSYEGRSAID